MVQVYICKTGAERPAGFTHRLVRHIAARYGGMDGERITIAGTPGGKPYIQDADSFHFNVSHSGDWVVCAVHTQPVGIDIEQVGRIDATLYREHLSAAEYYALQALPREEQQEHFYELWTLKESYMKQTGLGVQLAPSSFTIQATKTGYAVLQATGRPLTDIFFRQYDIAAGYKMAVCAIANKWGTPIWIGPADVTG
ncbi:4'-phosphopantetheinyl transferase superfamily protein [Nemorincola caseinilytica]|uniref:4'-phosphopantetheinyl transferase superfamily protein n=2 Tax=Nemorincola caseinilytica TaxID=2054315 RepID=A0ABP8N4Z3_9BACT